jgi:hypothetical protein
MVVVIGIYSIVNLNAPPLSTLENVKTAAARIGASHAHRLDKESQHQSD